MNLLLNMKTMATSTLRIERREGKTVDIYAHIFLVFCTGSLFLDMKIFEISKSSEASSGSIMVISAQTIYPNILKENVTLDQNKRIASETHVPSLRDCLLCFTQNFFKCISLKREIHEMRSGFKSALNLLKGHDIHSKVFAVCAYDCAPETTIKF